MNRAQALAIIAAWSIALSAAMHWQAPTGLRILLALPVLYTPGALFLGCLRIRQRRLNHLVSSLVVSFVLLIADGFALHLVGMITQTGWLLSISCMLVLFCLFGGAAALPVPRFPALPAAQVAALLASLAVAAGLAALGFRTSIADAHADRPFPVLELWLRPGPDAGRLQVGVNNGDAASITLALEIRGEGRVIQGRRTVNLTGKSSFRETVDYGRNLEKPERITALLYTDGGVLTRRVNIGVEPAPASPVDR